MRNNEERFGPPVMEDQTSAMQTGDNKLNFVTPTEIVELPSKGKFYPQGHPLHGQQEIEIKFMTAKEEDILTNKSLLRKGVAIDKMLQSLLTNPGLRVDDLLIGDKNAILLASRISAYGADYSVQVTCPACEQKQKQEFDLSNIMSKEIKEKEVPSSVSQTGHGTFLFTLPRSKVQVEFRLMTSADESKIAKQVISKKEVENVSTGQLKTCILSVNGMYDPQSIREVSDNMIASDARALRNIIKELTPEVDMTQNFSCENCDHEEELEVPLTAEFFWPK
jgi:hypothetical protein